MDAFNLLKEDCISETVVVDKGGILDLDNDASGVSIPGVIREEEAWNKKTILQLLHYGSRVLNSPVQKHGAHKNEMITII